MSKGKNSMTKVRVLIFAVTILVVTVVGYFASLYARGYKLNSKTGNFEANGLLVVKSDPDGAQINIDGEFKALTNTSIKLSPKKYDITISKEGFLPWTKTVLIEKEVVVEITAHLFSSAPSLSSITFSETSFITPSEDLTRLAYIVPLEPGGTNQDKAGLWVLEIYNLPLGFAREPKRITDGNLAGSQIYWSPDGREILLKTKAGTYLLNSSEFTPQTQRINVLGIEDSYLIKWKEETGKKLESQIKKLPIVMIDLLERKTSEVAFSPDENMILYTASSSADIPNHLVKSLPGSSSQRQERDIKSGRTYVYDIKEDRNFLIDDNSSDLTILGGITSTANRRISWYTTSRHLLISEPTGISIVDYDGTNRKTVYSGAYDSPNAFPTLNHDRLIILTNLGSISNPPYLYFLSIK